MAANAGLAVADVTGEYVLLNGEQYFRIANSHLMPDFFMSVVGASDHWMFISSNGALTAGRRNSDQALFPYAADDQISSARSTTGAVSIFRFDTDSGPELWEPFTEHAAGGDHIQRNLYKTPLGNKLVFEEVNLSRQLAFQYRWAFSNQFGFVRSCRLENLSQNSQSLELIDGLRNILPHGIGTEFQMRYSNLGNAYKKSELIAESGVGIYCLSSIPSDRAEPSEGLRATTVWQSGLGSVTTLLSTDQLPLFRRGGKLHTETDVRGKSGAYLINHSVQPGPGESISWDIVAEVGQDHCDIIRLNDRCQNDLTLIQDVAEDVAASEQAFFRILSTCDAMQCGANRRRTNRHLSNTVFNVMRGGIPLNDYRVETADFRRHVEVFNSQTFERSRTFLANLPKQVDAIELRRLVSEQNDPDLLRLALEYLPLAFSRRHGDPTRPWNHFSIDLRCKDGSTNLTYQGNWRDIFQNWEALGQSFPEFLSSMICRFVNATTADGYNPYRLTKDGFEWEEPSPGDSWSNIGYWGDHQIIYLLKLLELARQFQGQQLDTLLDSASFVHANIPYRIVDAVQIRRDPRNTIEFDSEAAAAIRERVNEVGADGKLLHDQNGRIHHVTLVEKLLTLSLAKLSNFVPDGGIWLNTQRPEWNDANNALVGNGLSMVTTCYLHRWFRFLHGWLQGVSAEQFAVSTEVAEFFRRIDHVLQQHSASLSGTLDESQREAIVAGLLQAGSDYRAALYESGVAGQTELIAVEDCLKFLETARQYVETTIWNNRRTDGLYHAYNLIDWNKAGIEVEHLYEMLEGQVAVLSSGLLTAAEAVELLDALRHSKLYRENQNSYLLYPDRQLPRFLNKNRIDQRFVDNSPLLQSLLAAADDSIVRRDVHGVVHFNGQFRNSQDLRAAIGRLGADLHSAVAEEGDALVLKFEEVFGHRQFTGRSGTFFAYEGLGSIYWHMVSKLSLAVSEHFFAAVESGAPSQTISALRNHLAEIRAGIGAEKSPQEYGAFPSDPYSHTPENSGVKQPGMTGQVKEDLLARFAEIGVHVEAGCLRFRLELFDHSELLTQASELKFFDLAGTVQTIQLPENGFGFTLFQVPFVYQAGDDDLIHVHFKDGSEQSIRGLIIDEVISRQLFSRSGTITRIDCQFKALQS